MSRLAESTNMSCMHTWLVTMPGTMPGKVRAIIAWRDHMRPCVIPCCIYETIRPSSALLRESQQQSPQQCCAVVLQTYYERLQADAEGKQAAEAPCKVDAQLKGDNAIAQGQQSAQSKTQHAKVYQTMARSVNSMILYSACEPQCPTHRLSIAAMALWMSDQHKMSCNNCLQQSDECHLAWLAIHICVMHHAACIIYIGCLPQARQEAGTPRSRKDRLARAPSPSRRRAVMSPELLGSSEAKHQVFDQLLLASHVCPVCKAFNLFLWPARIVLLTAICQKRMAVLLRHCHHVDWHAL